MYVYLCICKLSLVKSPWMFQSDTATAGGVALETSVVSLFHLVPSLKIKNTIQKPRAHDT
jgi:hypothetical protein